MATDDWAESIRTLAKEHAQCMATIEAAQRRALTIELELSIVKEAIASIETNGIKMRKERADKGKPRKTIPADEAETILNAVEARSEL